MKTYILTPEQLNTAVLAGLKTLGILHADPESKAQIQMASNGAILNFEDSQGKSPSKARTGPVQPTTGSRTYTVEQVKQALVSAMKRPPSISSIRTYSPVQLKAAMDWANRPSQPRPDFIKDRAPRGSRHRTMLPPPQTMPESGLNQMFGKTGTG